MWAESGEWIGPAWRLVQRADPCVYCWRKPDGLDHINPRALGGTDGWENRAPACGSCDWIKGPLPLLLFLVVRLTTDSSPYLHDERWQYVNNVINRNKVRKVQQQKPMLKGYPRNWEQRMSYSTQQG